MFHAGTSLDDGNDSKKRFLAPGFSWKSGGVVKYRQQLKRPPQGGLFAARLPPVQPILKASESEPEFSATLIGCW